MTKKQISDTLNRHFQVRFLLRTRPEMLFRANTIQPTAYIGLVKKGELMPTSHEHVCLAVTAAKLNPEDMTRSDSELIRLVLNDIVQDLIDGKIFDAFDYGDGVERTGTDLASYLRSALGGYINIQKMPEPAEGPTPDRPVTVKVAIQRPPPPAYMMPPPALNRPRVDPLLTTTGTEAPASPSEIIPAHEEVRRLFPQPLSRRPRVDEGPEPPAFEAFDDVQPLPRPQPPSFGQPPTWRTNLPTPQKGRKMSDTPTSLPPTAENDPRQRRVDLFGEERTPRIPRMSLRDRLGLPPLRILILALLFIFVVMVSLTILFFSDQKTRSMVTRLDDKTYSLARDFNSMTMILDRQSEKTNSEIEKLRGDVADIDLLIEGLEFAKTGADGEDAEADEPADNDDGAGPKSQAPAEKKTETLDDKDEDLAPKVVKATSGPSWNAPLPTGRPKQRAKSKK